MPNATLRVVEPLNLTQDRVSTAGFEDAVARWYGWSLNSGLIWTRKPSCLAGDDPDYACDVTTPGLMFGDPAEIRADIVAALRRHATALGLS